MSDDAPPWYRYAAKALAAFAVAVVAAAGIITAALADDRVTPSEWWQIGIAVLSALVGPGLVYKVQNDYGRVPAQRPALVPQVPARPPEHLGKLPMRPDRDTRPW